MKRRNFLTNLFNIGVGAAAMTIPVIAKSGNKETFTLDDEFIRHDGNKNLFYIKKDGVLNRELMKAIGGSYLPIDKFGCYFTIHGQYVPIKDKYTIEDFRQLIMFFEDKSRHYCFCDGQTKSGGVGLIRLLKDRSEKFYKIDAFQAFRNGQYGPE